MKRLLFDTKVKQSLSSRYLAQTETIGANIATGGVLRINSLDFQKSAKATCSIDLGVSGVNNVRAYGIMVGNTVVQSVATGGPVNFANGTELAQAILFDLFSIGGSPATANVTVDVNVNYNGGSVLEFEAADVGSDLNGTPIRILIHQQDARPGIGFILATDSNGEFVGDMNFSLEGNNFTTPANFSSTGYTITDLTDAVVSWIQGQIAGTPSLAGRYAVFNDGGDTVFLHKSNTETDVSPFVATLDLVENASPATITITDTGTDLMYFVPQQLLAGGQLANFDDVRLYLSNEFSETDLLGNLAADIAAMTDPTNATEFVAMLVSKMNALADFIPNGASPDVLSSRLLFSTTAQTGIYDTLVPRIEVVTGTATVVTSEETALSGGSTGAVARTPDFATIPKPRKGLINGTRIQLNGFVAYYLINEFPVGLPPETQDPYWDILANRIDVSIDGFGFQDYIETFTSGEYYVVFSKLLTDVDATFISNTPTDHLVFKISKHGVIPDMVLIHRVYFADPMKDATGFQFTGVEDEIIGEADAWTGLDGCAIVLTYAEQGSGALAISLNDVVSGELGSNHKQKIITGAIADSIEAWADGALLTRGIICNASANITLTHMKTEGRGEA